ncbi:response regulator transcription factor [Paenibacillus zeisoli]|uniref:Response regulator transcription factor n=1 Tax=Paenibacillus zeisoli TaxID=2496267 RepID=A0A433XCU3_9BACL|nr:response regulator transcription factor [Paenibacillus zeisoli]RUT31971.1 response regulator transcription factor [Paenibacillus zeisoli]
MMRDTILIIEDEDKIARLLEMELSYEGYEVERASTGREGLSKGQSGGWSVILLDIMLPELSGTEVLRRLRQTDPITPVILLTARDAVPDKVSGLDLGANDYITKPFEIEEVLARIRACIRNRKLGETGYLGVEEFPELTLGDLTVVPLMRKVTRGTDLIELTPKEYELLLYLLENRNQVLTRNQIISQVWGYDFSGDTNVVDVYIRYLRKKVDYPYKQQLIHTHRGVGYSIKET